MRDPVFPTDPLFLLTFSLAARCGRDAVGRARYLHAVRSSVSYEEEEGSVEGQVAQPLATVRRKIKDFASG